MILRWPARARSAIAAGSLAFYLLALFLAAHHQATTLHLVCPEHGELLSGHSHHRHDPAEQQGPQLFEPQSPGSLDRPDPLLVHLDHVHCGLSLHLQTQVLNSPPDDERVRLPQVRSAATGMTTRLLPAPWPLYLLAPKHGPPRCSSV